MLVILTGASIFSLKNEAMESVACKYRPVDFGSKYFTIQSGYVDQTSESHLLFWLYPTLLIHKTGDKYLWFQIVAY